MSVVMNKECCIKEYGSCEKDTGSAEVQIALFTFRIKNLTEHLFFHKKDKQTLQTLLKMSSRRNKLLKYLLSSKGLEYVTGLKQKLSLR